MAGAGAAIVAASYAIERELARTETGVVYEGRDLRIDRAVAIKLARRDPGAPSLLPEARRCAAVRDPSAVAIYATGSHDGAEYVVGERVTGRLVNADLATKLPADLYLSRVRAIVAAVAHAHDAGIAVGDVSGATVLACFDGRLVLGRLSLSQVPAFGRHGKVLAPEVLRGEVAPTDPSAAEAIDLYGLGCFALELAAGAPPFFEEDDLQRELDGHANEPPPRLVDLRTDVPRELSDLVDWLLAKNPAARPRSAGDVLAQLDVIRERAAAASRALRVLIVTDDPARSRWLWSLARRAHAGAIVEIASDGPDAGHKLNRDHPELVLIDAGLRGIMNAFELCMFARGVDQDIRVHLLGNVSERDRALLADEQIAILPDDRGLADAVLDRVRTAAATAPRRTRRPSLVSG